MFLSSQMPGATIKKKKMTSSTTIIPTSLKAQYSFLHWILKRSKIRSNISGVLRNWVPYEYDLPWNSFLIQIGSNQLPQAVLNLWWWTSRQAWSDPSGIVLKKDAGCNYSHNYCDWGHLFWNTGFSLRVFGVTMVADNQPASVVHCSTKLFWHQIKPVRKRNE